MCVCVRVCGEYNHGETTNPLCGSLVKGSGSKQRGGQQQQQQQERGPALLTPPSDKISSET